MQMIWYNKPHPDDSDDGAHGYIKYAEIDVVTLLAPKSSMIYGHPGWDNPALRYLGTPSTSSTPFIKVEAR